MNENISKFNISSKIILSFLGSGFILWLGGSVVRSAIAFDLFVPGSEMVLKDGFNDTIGLHTVHLFAVTAFYTAVGYSVAFLSAIILCFKHRSDLKLHGWMFMAFVMFFLTAPVESYLIYYDVQLNYALNAGPITSFGDPAVTEYFIGRFKDLSLPAVMSLLAGVTSMLILAWRPLDKSTLFVSAPKEEESA